MAGIKIPEDAWILVGDGEKALILQNAGDETHPNLKLIRFFEQDNPPDREQGRDRPGRRSDGSGLHKSATEETDWHRLEKHRFAKDVADALYKAAHKGRFRDLIIVAPPLILGELRKSLHVEVSSRVLAEIDKTLTGHPVHKIETILLTKS